MAKPKFLAVALITATTLAAPALAAGKHVGSRHTTADAPCERRARTTENLLPAILAAVEAYASVGEISDALRRVYGEYHESVVI